MDPIQLQKHNKSTGTSELVNVDDIWESLGIDNLHILKLNGAVTVGEIEYTWFNHPDWRRCSECKKPVHVHRMWAYENRQHHYQCLPVAYRLHVGNTPSISAA